jgi:hypothetical protein
LRNIEVINRGSKIVSGGGSMEVVLHLDGEKQALWLRAFVIGYAYAETNFKVGDGYFGHGA